MGLSLCYELRMTGTFDEGRERIAALREFALTQDFGEVGDLVVCGAAEDDDTSPPNLSPTARRFYRLLGTQYGQKGTRNGAETWVEIPPLRVVTFAIQPAEGCETANFGLAVHPAVIEPAGGSGTTPIETGLAGLCSWTQCCKTQYAGLSQYGGVENFVFAHVRLVRCLDHAAELGLDVQVTDDSGYWESRDLEALRRSLGEWNGLIAAFAGQLKDQLQGAEAVGLRAPILTAPDFEHLEARGLSAWTEGNEPSDDAPPAA